MFNTYTQVQLFKHFIFEYPASLGAILVTLSQHKPQVGKQLALRSYIIFTFS